MRTSLKLIGGKKIESPKSNKTRPTSLMVREAIFNILNKNVYNSDWLDLFSGTGSISCEAYNHGAKRIVAIEKDRINAELCKKNLFSLNESSTRQKDIDVICMDVFSWIKSQKIKSSAESNFINNLQFDYIYIDPPYLSNFYELLLKTLFDSSLIKKNTTIIYEHSKNEEIKKNDLWSIKDIRVYGQTKLTFLIKI